MGQACHPAPLLYAPWIIWDKGRVCLPISPVFSKNLRRIKPPKFADPQRTIKNEKEKSPLEIKTSGDHWYQP